ncbi:YqjF family protein [Halorarius litoreus]|uniref:YqjF family protein n=1 Tax=Halorarius litoreus TaxID=2962676 RepID=UPI0020CDAF9E|nr:DUF2071 domain-containing protein [Halorarius litoreus]
MAESTPGHTLDELGLVSMTWRDVLFAHWPVAPDVVAETLPEGLSVDTFDGRAYLGVVGFVMDRIRPRGSPIGRSFGELNLRTYVRDDADTPGIYFYNLDASDRLGVWLARKLFRLPYYPAEMRVERRGRSVEFTADRVAADAPPVAFDATYEPDGAQFEAEPETLPFFLTERYRFYTESRPRGGHEPGDGRLYYGDIGHEPWPLYEATADIRENGLFAANGFEQPDGEPLCHYSPKLDVLAGRVHRV